MNIGSYFEIPVTDLDRAMKFYSAVFGCDFARDVIHGNEMAFFSFYEGRPGITGALAKGDIYVPSITGTLIYLATQDIDETLARLGKIGSEILFPKTPVGETGFVAEFKDSEGNRVALFQQRVQTK